MTQVFYEISGKKFRPPQQRAYANSVTRNFFDLEILLDEPKSHINLRGENICAGPFRMSRSYWSGFSHITAQRSWKQIRNNQIDLYTISVPIHGSLRINQNGRSVLVSKGEIAISATNKPYRMESLPDGAQRHFSMHAYIPAHLFSSLVRDPEQLCGSAYAGSAGTASLANTIFSALFDESDRMSRRATVAAFSTAVDLIAEGIMGGDRNTVEFNSLKEERLRRLLDYLTFNLSNPDLTAKLVAKSCGISTRYLYEILREDQKTFRNFLWEHRLECARQQLSDSNLRHRTISEIAFRSGFKSNAHFSNMFRKTFGCSPREFRRVAHDIANPTMI